MQRNYDFSLKIVLLGPSGSGKTSILKRYADNTFDESLLATIGVDFRFKSINSHQDFIKLQIWDTAGQQRFRNVISIYYKDTDAIILVADIMNPLSFRQLQQYWYEQSRRNCKKQCKIYLFVNKNDNFQLQMQQKDKRWCIRQNIIYFYVSAKSGIGIAQAFLQIAHDLKQNKPRQQNTKIIMGLNEFNPQLKKKKCC